MEPARMSWRGAGGAEEGDAEGAERFRLEDLEGDGGTTDDTKDQLANSPLSPTDVCPRRTRRRSRRLRPWTWRSPWTPPWTPSRCPQG